MYQPILKQTNIASGKHESASSYFIQNTNNFSPAFMFTTTKAQQLLSSLDMNISATVHSSHWLG
uniref:Uncharacterized protein n=1 Tax=Arion vulgaris TaxID=1028688 RepID=A0A0B7BAV4_9EUPU